jgi:signal transduction histidine kinase
MEADVLPTIFDSLVQGPTTIDRSLGGLGLGLSIAKGLVELHDGTITAHSEGVGRGSTFVVRLPLAEPDAEAVPQA